MPAAFPALTYISWLARMEVCAGAMRVSSATGLPSATIETQVVFSARISKVKVAGGFAAVAGEADFATGAAGGVAVGLVVVPVVDAVGDGGRVVLGAVVDAMVAVGGVVLAEMVPAESFPADKVPAGDDWPPVREPAGLDGWVVGDAGVENGAGTEVGD